MKINYDKEVNAVYIQLSKKEEESIETDSFEIKNLVPFGDINFDFNKEGKIIGIEILNANRYLDLN